MLSAVPGEDVLYTRATRLSGKSLDRSLKSKCRWESNEASLIDVEELNDKVPTPFYIPFSTLYIQYPILDPRILDPNRFEIKGT